MIQLEKIEIPNFSKNYNNDKVLALEIEKTL